MPIRDYYRVRELDGWFYPEWSITGYEWDFKPMYVYSREESPNRPSTAAKYKTLDEAKALIEERHAKEVARDEAHKDTMARTKYHMVVPGR